MTANKHTPGPWSVEGVGIRALVRAGINGVIVAVRHRLPAGEHEANTHLIAAAPELLAALERIASPHDCGCVPCTGQCRSQIALEIAVEEMQGLARAAIAKAGGAA